MNHHDQRSFTHVGTFDVENNGTGVTEIVTATRDGKILPYTDSQDAAGSTGWLRMGCIPRTTAGGPEAWPRKFLVRFVEQVDGGTASA